MRQQPVVTKVDAQGRNGEQHEETNSKCRPGKIRNRAKRSEVDDGNPEDVFYLKSFFHLFFYCACF